MEQKIIQVGNSTGIIIPKDLLNKLGWKFGAEVVLEQEGNSLVIVGKGSQIKKTTLSPKFLKILEKVNKQYGPALKELAGK